MKEFANSRDIQLETSAPYHPSSNPAETFMKTLGKATKIGFRNKEREADTIQSALKTYRQTPHPATNIPPASMLFRDGVRSGFPRAAFSEEEIKESQARDHKLKQQNQQKTNNSKYRKEVKFLPGDKVLIRNYKKTSKFEPTFLPEPFIITQYEPTSGKCIVENEEGVLVRHSDDLKPCHHQTNHQDKVNLEADGNRDNDFVWAEYEDFTETENPY